MGYSSRIDLVAISKQVLSFRVSYYNGSASAPDAIESIVVMKSGDEFEHLVSTAPCNVYRDNYDKEYERSMKKVMNWASKIFEAQGV